MNAIISAVVAYMVTRFIFNLMGFHYDLLNDPFELGKAALDIGAFAAVYLATNLLLKRLLPPAGGGHTGGTQ